VKAHPSHKATESAATRERWVKLCKVIKAKDNPHTGRTVDNTYDELRSSYSGPYRHYHNLDHISDGLGLIDKVWHIAEHPDVLEMAWWWHDETYKTRRSDNKPNELVSALNAFHTLRELSVSDKICVGVMARIMPTLHTYIPNYIDDRLIVDIDLASLATPPDVFTTNSENIRKEYFASAEEYRIGRVNFFRKFIEGRPSIYLTKYFHERYEAQAQKNIRDYLAKSEPK